MTGLLIAGGAGLGEGSGATPADDADDDAAMLASAVADDGQDGGSRSVRCGPFLISFDCTFRFFPPDFRSAFAVSPVNPVAQLMADLSVWRCRTERVYRSCWRCCSGEGPIPRRPRLLSVPLSN